jgi:hypothetical protein
MSDYREALDDLDRLGRKVQLLLDLYDNARARMRVERLATRLALLAIFIATVATFASERF